MNAENRPNSPRHGDKRKAKESHGPLTYKLGPKDVAALAAAGFGDPEDIQRIEAVGTVLSKRNGYTGLNGGSYAYYPMNWNLTKWLASDGSQFDSTFANLLIADVDDSVLYNITNQPNADPSIFVHAKPDIEHQADQEDYEARMMRGESIEKAADKLVNDLIEGHPDLEAFKHTQFAVNPMDHQDLMANIGQWVMFKSSTGKGTSSLLPYKIVHLQKDYADRVIYRVENQLNPFGRPASPDEVKIISQEEAQRIWDNAVAMVYGDRAEPFNPDF